MGLLKIALRSVSFRFGQHLLTFAGIACGVALVVAMSMVTRVSSQSFADAIDDLAGASTLEVAGQEAGVAEEVLEVVRRHPAVAEATPLVLGTVYLADDSGDSLTVVGVDLVNEDARRTYRATDANDEEVEDPLVFLNSRESVLVTKAFLARHGLRIDDRIPVATSRGMSPLHVRGVLRPEGPARLLGEHLAVMDIYAAQWVFGKDRSFDRITLTLVDSAEPDVIAHELQPLLPAGLIVRRPEARISQFGALLAGFRHTLGMLSLFGLLLGVFMAYNSVSTAVARRRHEIGILRALGCRRAQVVRLVVAESAIIGIGASALGCALGIQLARLLVASVTQAAEAQSHVALEDPSLGLPQLSDGLKALTGLLAAVAASLIPARAASRVSITHALRPGLSQGFSSSWTHRLLRVGLVVLALAVIGIVVGARLPSPPLLGSATLLLVTAFLLLAAATGSICVPRCQRLAGRLFGVRGAIAAGSVARQPQRIAFTAAVLAVGSALVAFLAIVEASTRSSLLDEIHHAVRADLMVESAFLTTGTLTQPIDAAVGEAIARLPHVDAVVLARRVSHPFRGRTVSISAVSDAYYEAPRFGRRVFLGADPDRAFRDVAAGPSAIVSENFASNFDVRAGETVELDTPQGTLRLHIAGIVVDNVHGVGTIAISRTTYQRWWRDALVNWIYVYLDAPGLAPTVREDILRSFQDTFRLRVLDSREILAQVSDTVASAFSFTTGLEAAVLLVVLLGLADTLLVSVLQQVRDLGVMRAIGALRTDVVRTIVIESFIISAVGGGVGLIQGTVLAAIWLRLHFKALFGWSFSIHVPFGLLATTLLLIGGIALVASILPARWASRLNVRRSLAYE